ncbi:MAG: NAD(P)/FAD-dependent oxidoreductase [Defluviitaleaceae bacterium]|nr:NAD(P)/FAD-dependent oxidoreductase [Defluviitaleaceae bacterium]
MYDCIIIGGGIIGSATARALSRYDLKILLIEKGADVAIGATKANSGILHAGYDCHPGTLKATLNVQGVAMYPKLVEELDIPCRVNGSMVISLDDDGPVKLQALYEKGILNGVKEMELLSPDEALTIEPNLTDQVAGALRAKTAGVISPYEAGIAFGESAAINGVGFLLETTVTGIEVGVDGFTVLTSRKPIKTKTIVNAAGVESANIHNYISPRKETIIPQRGQYYILDNTQRNLIKHTVFQLPTHLGKGVLVVPTVDYNILLGPTAELPENPAATDTTVEGLKEALEKVSLSLKNIPIADRITAYAGIRAKHESKDFVIEESIPGFVDAIGIDSPGLSAAPAIAERIAGFVSGRLQPKLNLNFQPIRVGIKKFRELSKNEQANLIKENPAYGRIICRCETITEGEILDAIHKPIGARNLDAIKRRTRAQMGRCQGGFCKIRLVELLARELGIPETAVTMDGAGSEVCLSRV